MDGTRVVDDVRLALRLGFYREAIAMLDGATCDPATRLNLLGVAREATGDLRAARRCFSAARRAEPGCRAADQNLRRVYELDALGWTGLPVALGDERPALAALLAARRPARAGRVESRVE